MTQRGSITPPTNQLINQKMTKIDFDFRSVDTCLYHKDCADGFASAWILYNHNRDRFQDIKFIPMTHGMNPDDIKLDIIDKNVLIVDFSFKRNVLLELQPLAKNMLVVDHHKTAKEDLEGLPFAIFDMDKCGASLLWNLVRGGTPVPFIQYIEDRDLWKWKLPNSKAINSVIQITPQDFKSWDDLFYGNIDSLIERGIHIEDSFTYLAKTTAKDARLVELNVTIYGEGRSIEHKTVKMRVVSCGVSNLISETLHEVLEAFDDVDVACSYTIFPDGGQLYSLRSRLSFDCSWIAKAFGGGGHAQACGFKRKDVFGFPWGVLG